MTCLLNPHSFLGPKRRTNQPYTALVETMIFARPFAARLEIEREEQLFARGVQVDRKCHAVGRRLDAVDSVMNVKEKSRFKI